jgi:hypothetical protein
MKEHALYTDIDEVHHTKGTRQRKGATTGKKSPAKEPSGPWWPPRRKHHKKEETVEFKIQARRDAFVAKRLINSSSTEAGLAKRMRYAPPCNIRLTLYSTS